MAKERKSTQSKKAARAKKPAPRVLGAKVKKATARFAKKLAVGVAQNALRNSPPRGAADLQATLEEVSKDFEQTRRKVAAKTATSLVGLCVGDLARVGREMGCTAVEVEQLIRVDLERIRAAQLETPNDIAGIAERVGLSLPVVLGMLQVGQAPEELSEEAAKARRRSQSFFDS